MKRLITLILLLVLSGCILYAQTTNTYPKEPYHQFLSCFSDSTAYAMVTLGGHPVLLISRETFQDFLEEDSNQRPYLAAISAQVFTIDAQGKIIALGELRSQGTLYPIQLKDDALWTAGHHFVNKFSLRDNPIELELMEDVIVSYDTTGDPTCYYENRSNNIYRSTTNENDYDTMIDAFVDANPIVFSLISTK